MHPKVDIIVINWNNKADTIACLDSLKSLNYPDFKIIVIDNGSTDDSVIGIKKAYPSITLIENRKNLGFSGGNNVGIRLALNDGADYVLLINNDTVVDSGFLGELIRVVESDPSIGIVGPKIYYYDDPKRIWFAGGAINYWWGHLYHVGYMEEDVGKYDVIRDVDSITGCAMLIKRKVLEEIGLLCEDMFLYFEDTDFCVRAYKKGYRLVYVPTSVIWHKVSRTTSKIKGLQFYYNIRNWLIFMRRHASPLQLAVFLPFYAIRYMGYNVIVAILTGNFSEAKLYLKATYDGLTHRCGTGFL